ncbi:MAG TPA: YciI family protein [Spirochaetia bacterium]|nr:YciI family protein [Spirochaetia bacterium]
MMLMMAGTRAEFESYLKWSREELKAQVAFMRSFAKDLEDAGVLVMTEGLAFPDQARMVRAGSDGAPVTDGVFPESKEFLAGFWIIDVDTPEEAYRIAARASAGPGPKDRGTMPIEVRPVMDRAPDEWQ